jgi:hypothetical protein
MKPIFVFPTRLALEIQILFFESQPTADFQKNDVSNENYLYILWSFYYGTGQLIWDGC